MTSVFLLEEPVGPWFETRALVQTYTFFSSHG